MSLVLGPEICFYLFAARSAPFRFQTLPPLTGTCPLPFPAFSRFLHCCSRCPLATVGSFAPCSPVPFLCIDASRPPSPMPHVPRSRQCAGAVVVESVCYCVVAHNYWRGGRMRAVMGLKEQAVKSIKETAGGLTSGSHRARRLSGGLDDSSHDFKPAEVTHGEGKVKRAEESLRTVMYLSCWGPN